MAEDNTAPQPGTVKVTDLAGSAPIADKVYEAVQQRTKGK